MCGEARLHISPSPLTTESRPSIHAKATRIAQDNSCYLRCSDFHQGCVHFGSPRDKVYGASRPHRSVHCLRVIKLARPSSLPQRSRQARPSPRRPKHPRTLRLTARLPQVLSDHDSNHPRPDPFHFPGSFSSRLLHSCACCPRKEISSTSRASLSRKVCGAEFVSQITWSPKLPPCLLAWPTIVALK